MPLRVRPYSITPFGRRAGLVQWVRHTTSLYGLFRNWQQCTAERYQAVAAAKRDAAAAAAAATAAAASAPVAGSGPGERQSERQPPAAGSAAAAKGAADGGSSSVPLPLIVAASRPPDAFYARLLPALQAAGLPVGSARSSWPASKAGFGGLVWLFVHMFIIRLLAAVCFERLVIWQRLVNQRSGVQPITDYVCVSHLCLVCCACRCAAQHVCLPGS